MEIFKNVTNYLPRVISYMIFYSPIFLLIGLLSNFALTLFYSYIIMGTLVVLLLDLSLADMLISHHFLSRNTKRTLATVEIDKFSPYEKISIDYSIDVPKAKYTNEQDKPYSLWINTRNINASKLRHDQQIELVYSVKYPMISQIAVDWDINNKKHIAENIAQLVLSGIFIIFINWGFVVLTEMISEFVAQF